MSSRFIGLVALVVIAIVLGACSWGVSFRLGDRGHGIWFHNATDQQLTLYELGRSHTDVGVHDFAPNAVVPSTWSVPASASDDRTVRVEAVNAGGTVVYCRQFGWSQLEAVTWHVEVTNAGDCER